MIVMTSDAGRSDHADADAPGGVCWRCGGPCLTYKGTVHGWTCTACLNRYLDEAAAKGAARDRKDRERLARKALDNANRTSVTEDRRLEGGASVMYRPPSGVDSTGEGGGLRYVPRRAE